MIEIIKGRIHWYEGYANPPGLELLVSRHPRLEEHRFTKRGSLYFSELDGMCSFFSWDGRPDRGFGGHVFKLNMADGTTAELIGPWSSSPSAMNAAGFTPCTDAAVTDEPDAYERGYTFTSAALTLDMIGRYRDRIAVPPYRFRYEEPWAWGTKGFSHRIVFPEGSMFTMLHLKREGKHSTVDTQVSSQQGALLGGPVDGFIPIVELPDGTHWVKPTGSHKDPIVVPPSCTVEEVPSRVHPGRTYMGTPI